ncbi:MAG: PEP-CTERM sorting domain-containing protein [Prosthecobacter sp.]
MGNIVDNFDVLVGAVPEPSRALLLGLGVAGIVFRRRRQGKA